MLRELLSSPCSRDRKANTGHSPTCESQLLLERYQCSNYFEERMRLRPWSAHSSCCYLVQNSFLESWVVSWKARWTLGQQVLHCDILMTVLTTTESKWFFLVLEDLKMPFIGILTSCNTVPFRFLHVPPMMLWESWGDLGGKAKLLEEYRLEQQQHLHVSPTSSMTKWPAFVHFHSVSLPQWLRSNSCCPFPH